MRHYTGKQEMILDGLAARLFEESSPSCGWSVTIQKEHFRDKAFNLLKYLQAEGGVLKVNKSRLSGQDKYNDLTRELFEGYEVAVIEPLVEE